MSGGWFGALDKSTCGLNDYYYHQCHSKVKKREILLKLVLHKKAHNTKSHFFFFIVSTLPLGIISIVLISIIIISVLIGMGIFCCCLCCQCCQGNDVEEEGGQDGEDAPLLGSKYLRRSSTYYQWNRPIPESDKNNKKSKSKKIQQQKKKPSTVTTASTANTTNDAQQIDYLLLPESLPSGGEGGESSNTAKSWEDRRSALLKKYGRDTN